jgi:hypothetical protein
MTLDQIQPNIRAILVAMQLFLNKQAHILIDDGQQEKVMEESLKTEGLSVLIMLPQAVQVRSQGQGAVSMEYVTTVWVRTNPKVKVANAAKWNPLTGEKAIIPAVLGYGEPPVNYFQIAEGLEPETDFSDVGNNSRLIRFSTCVLMQ